MSTYRLFPSTNGPASPTGYSGPFLAGVTFQVTSWATWFEGYWWWVPSGGDTGAQKFALWQVTGNNSGTLVSAATTTSGTLTAGQWNYIPLTTPVPLSADIPYTVATGWSVVHGFPITAAQFGSGDPYSGGITNGPLSAYSDIGGSAPVPSNWQSQGAFGVAGTDPTAHMPAGSDGSSNFWMDLQVSDTSPTSGTTYRLWPSMPVPPNMIQDQALDFTLATEFKLSQSCSLNNVWFYSPSGAPNLPTECGIYSQSTQTLVSGTHNTSPTWSGAAGTGWVACSYSGITLPAGSYRVAVSNSAGTTGVWNSATLNYFSSGAGASGITNGPISAPSETTADSPGQGSYNAGSSLAWPGTYDTGGAPCYWIDVEVTPVATAPSPGLLMAGII